MSGPAEASRNRGCEKRLRESYAFVCATIKRCPLGRSTRPMTLGVAVL